MDFFNRIYPGYRCVSQAAYVQPGASSGLTCLIGSMFGHTTPAYKTIGGPSAYASGSSGFWSMFGSGPSYKTAPAMSAEQQDPLAIDAGDPGADEDPCELGPDRIVVL